MMAPKEYMTIQQHLNETLADLDTELVEPDFNQVYQKQQSDRQYENLRIDGGDISYIDSENERENNFELRRGLNVDRDHESHKTSSDVVSKIQ